MCRDFIISVHIFRLNKFNNVFNFLCFCRFEFCIWKIVFKIIQQIMCWSICIIVIPITIVVITTTTTIIINISLITLLSIYLLGNLHISQTVGVIRLSGEGNSSYPVRSRGVSQEFAYYMALL